MSVRTHAQVIRVSIFLLSIYSFLTYLEKPRRLNLVTFIVTIYFTVTSIEYPFLLILIFPVFFIYFQKPLSRKFFNLCLIWYSIPICYVCYYLLNGMFTETYLVGRQLSIFGEIPAIISVHFRSLYVLLFSGWMESLSAPLTLQRVGFVAGLIILLTFIGYRMKQSEALPIRNLQKAYFLYILSGLMIIIVSTTIFSVFPSYRNSDWRMYFYGSIGAAIVVPTFFYLIFSRFISHRHSKQVFFVVFLILFGIAFNHSAHQFEEYWNVASDKAKFMLDDFRQQYEITSEDVEIIYLTDLTSDDVENKIDAFITEPYLRISVMQLATSKRIASFNFCFLSEDNCEFQSKSLRFSISPYLPDEVIPYENILFFWIDSDFTIRFLDVLPDTPEVLSRAKGTYHPSNHLKLRSG